MRLFLFLLFFSSQGVLAHQSALSNSGEKAHWPTTNVPVTISTNSSDLSSSQIQNTISNSMNEWNSASSFKFVSGPGINSISFKNDFSEYGSGVVGVTEVTYNSGGVIQKADIFLNDNYNFKSTSGIYGGYDVFLGDVVTHELGHMLGLSHSEVLDASMFYASFTGQNTISYDDKSGVRTKYGPGPGSISGTVFGGSHIPVLGVHVQAISRRTGEAVGAVTDENGKFKIGGLDLNDTFYIYTSPLKNPDSLPTYFSNVQNDFCPGSYIGSFFQPCGRENDGLPNAINLTSLAPHQNVGAVTINCSLKSSTDYSLEKLNTTFNPLSIFDYGLEPRLEKSFVGFFNSNTNGWSDWDKFIIDLRSFPASSGFLKLLKLSLIGRKLGNQLEYEMKIFQNGSPTALQTVKKNTLILPMEMDLSSFFPLSSTLSENIFEIHIRAKRLDSYYLYQTFPEPERFSSLKSLPYLLIMGLWEDRGGSSGHQPLMDSESNLSDNYSCLEAPFTFKVSKVIAPNEKKTTQRDAAPAASCGTIEPPSSGGGTPPGLTLLLGFFIAALASEVLKNSKKFLS
jgi:hypothetical protein